jgi:imidazolonepropionase-like amidohydrolase
MKPELVPILTEAAHAKGMLVTGHIPVHMLAHEAVRAGYDGIEHINMLFLNFLATHETDTRTTQRFTLVGDKATTLDLKSKPVLDFIALLREKKTVIDPTLIAFQDLLVGEPGKIIAGMEGLIGRMPPQVQRGFLVNGLPIDADKRPLYRAAYDKMLELVKTLYEAKVHVVIGTDWVGGLGFEYELVLYARAGIPNAGILRMATLDAARAMKLEGKLGSITAGKVADLLIMPGDPLADIKAVQQVKTVVSRGNVFDSAKLYQAVGVAAN